MKVIDVAEASGNLSKIIVDAAGGEHIVLKDGACEVTLHPRGVFNPEEDSVELEEELLKAAKGPFTPYSREELRAYTNQLIQQYHSK